MANAMKWAAVLNGDYEVSDTGLVRRAKPGRGSTFVGRHLTPHQLNGGHLIISVWEAGRRRRYLVHVLVAGAFLGPKPDGMEVNHMDGDPTNNRIGNLEYLTHADNIRHGWRDKKGERHFAAKLTDAQVAEIRSSRLNGARGCDLARTYGITQQTICDITKGRSRV